MRAAERREYQLSRIGLALVDTHSRQTGEVLGQRRYIAEIQLGINALRVHIHGEGNDIHVSCALAVAEESSLDALCTCKESHFRVSHRTAAVVVGVEGDYDVFAVFQVLAHILYLICVNMGH